MPYLFFTSFTPSPLHSISYFFLSGRGSLERFLWASRLSSTFFSVFLTSLFFSSSAFLCFSSWNSKYFRFPLALWWFGSEIQMKHKTIFFKLAEVWFTWVLSKLNFCHLRSLFPVFPYQTLEFPFIPYNISNSAFISLKIFQTSKLYFEEELPINLFTLQTYPTSASFW